MTLKAFLTKQQSCTFILESTAMMCIVIIYFFGSVASVPGHTRPYGRCCWQVRLGEIPMVIGDGDAPPDCNSLTTAIWILFYGCALHAAGFFIHAELNFLDYSLWPLPVSFFTLFFQAFLFSPFLQAGFRVLTDTGSSAAQTS